MNDPNTFLKKPAELIKREEAQVNKIRETYEQKYPVLFAIGAGFGIVSTFYGFEKLIDRVDLFVNNPWILLATGLATLMVTGSFYNKLR